jgi:hypothetical protein
VSDDNILIYRNPNAKVKTPETIAEIRLNYQVQNFGQMTDEIATKIYLLLKEKGYTQDPDDYYDYILVREAIRALALRSVGADHPFHHFVYNLFSKNEDGTFRMNDFDFQEG